MTLRVAIAGRPNVGKSTLFNRLAGRQLALVHDEPGVTRDRREADAKLGELRFTIIDTAGLDESPDGSLEARMQHQTGIALEDADVILFLVDGRGRFHGGICGLRAGQLPGAVPAAGAWPQCA